MIDVHLVHLMFPRLTLKGIVTRAVSYQRNFPPPGLDRLWSLRNTVRRIPPKYLFTSQVEASHKHKETGSIRQ